jgi:uncharacterized RDD family membrane protein YckC
MFCPKCGANVGEGAAFCNACGSPVGGVGIAPPVSVTVAAAPAAYITSSAAPGVAYAGFWLRFVAYLIDGFLVTVVSCVFAVVAIVALGGGAVISALKDAENSGDVFPFLFMGWVLVFIFVSLLATWLYYAKMESSPSQGTLGKMALGLIVTDLEGRRITFGRASGRFFAKLITGIVPLAIGYIMAGFTEKRQALHDMIAACLVLRKL